MSDFTGATNASTEPMPTTSTDPFPDLNSLRLSQDFAAQTVVRPYLTSIAVRKPQRHEFIRVRPGTEWTFQANLLKDVETGDFYMVTAALAAELAGDVKPFCLFACMCRNSIAPFLWPIQLPGPDGRWNPWHETATASARRAEQKWLKVTSDRSSQSYVPHEAREQFETPNWPDNLSMGDLIKLAFRDRLILDVSHPLLRRLRGEV